MFLMDSPTIFIHLFYYQINLAFFSKKAFKHQVNKKEPKTQKKDYFFLLELSVYLEFAERRIPAYWPDLGVEQFIGSFAAL